LEKKNENKTMKDHLMDEFHNDDFLMFKNDIKAEETMKRARANYEKVRRHNRWK